MAGNQVARGIIKENIERNSPKRVERIPIDEKSHPCWGHYAANSKNCQFCRVGMECHLEKIGEL